MFGKKIIPDIIKIKNDKRWTQEENSLQINEYTKKISNLIPLDSDFLEKHTDEIHWPIVLIRIVDSHFQRSYFNQIIQCFFKKFFIQMETCK